MKLLLDTVADSFSLLHTAWQTVLLRPGNVVQKMDDKGNVFAGGLVLYTGHVGALVWKVKPAIVNAYGPWEMKATSAGADCWGFVSVTGPMDAWHVARTRGAAPMEAAQLAPGLSTTPPGVLLIRDGPEVPLLTHAAEHAFAGVTMVYMRKLCALLETGGGVPWETTTTEGGWARALVLHVLGPGVDIGEVVQQRFKPRYQEFLAVLEEEVLATARDALDASKFEDSAKIWPNPGRWLLVRSLAGASSMQMHQVAAHLPLQLQQGIRAFLQGQRRRPCPSVILLVLGAWSR